MPTEVKLVEPVPGGFRLRVHATPGARRAQVGGTHDGALRVAVTQPADDGKANRAIKKLLAKTLGLSASQVELVSGTTHRRKTFVLHAAPPEIPKQITRLAIDD